MRPIFGLCEKITSPKEILKPSIISYLINANQSNPNMEKKITLEMKRLQKDLSTCEGFFSSVGHQGWLFRVSQ